MKKLIVLSALFIFFTQGIPADQEIISPYNTDAAWSADNTMNMNYTDLVGLWKNVDPNTYGIVKIKIRTRLGSLTIRPYGNCTPKLCDWGEHYARSYATNVKSNQAISFTISINQGFCETILTGKLQGDKLIVDVFTVFTDYSYRYAYSSTYTFQK